MYTLLQENKDLRKKVSSLEEEALLLKKDLGVSKSENEKLLAQKSSVTTCRSCASGNRDRGALKEEGKDTYDDDDDDDDDDGDDAEIADLISRNADSLRQIRADTMSLKREIMRKEMCAVRPRTAGSTY